VRELKLPDEKGSGIVKNFRRAPWHSLRLEQPFSAGVIEPIYKFRKAAGQAEFWVGARSGQVRLEFGQRSP